MFVSLVDRQRQPFLEQVIKCYRLLFLRLGRTESCLSGSNYRLYATHTKEEMQWRSQTWAHTGLGLGVSNAKVLRRRVSTATRLGTVALRQYCHCAPELLVPRHYLVWEQGLRSSHPWQSRSQALVCTSTLRWTLAKACGRMHVAVSACI